MSRPKMRLFFLAGIALCGWAGTICIAAAQSGSHAPHPVPSTQFNGNRAYQYAQQFVNCGPRWIGSTGHLCAENFLKKQFAKDNLEEDSFTTNTSVGVMSMHNFIVKFPGRKNGIIVVASHYETNYWL